MQKFFFTLLLLIGVGSHSMVLAQENNFDIQNIWANPTDLYFKNIQDTMEAYYTNRDKGRGSGYKQWKRFEYRMKDRLDPKGYLTNITARNHEAMKSYYYNKTTAAQTGEWEFLTPSEWTNGTGGYNPGIGRVNCIAFHPTDENILFVGTPNGGIWKSDDRGASWAPMHDGMPTLGVSSIVVHPTQPDTMYILTGDGDGSQSYSIGVLKTYDAGITWDTTGLVWEIEDFEKGYKMVMHPNNYNIMLIATTDGIYKTADGGDSWTKEASGTFRDLEYHPGDPSIMYAEKSAGFYRSSNGGNSWSQITSGTPTGGNRMAIAVTPNHPNTVYLLCGPAPSNGVFKGFFRSTDSGLNFTEQTTIPNILGYDSAGSDNSSQNWYDIAMAAHPTIDNKVYTGGINVWRTLDATIFTNISQWVFGGTYTHADIHALEYNPINNYLYCGSDGGIFESVDGGDSWTNISDGLATMQFYKIAGIPSNSDLLLGGTQDNGTNKWTGGTDMTHIFGADGMDCMINYDQPDTLFFCFQNGGLRRSYNGGDSNTNVKPGGASGSWVTPIMMDPVNPDIIYGGYSDVYKSTNGGNTWTNKGADGRSAMAMGTNDTDRLYAARNTTLRTSANGGDSWTTITGPWSGQNVTGIVVDPDDASVVFVTVSGYVSGSKVYKSVNAGSSWTNYSGSLPNVPFNCIAFEDTDGSPGNAIYAGSDIGVFYRNDDLGDWLPFTNGLPTVEVKDLEINLTKGVIRAGTFGRSIWTSPLYSPCPVSLFLTVANNPGQTDVSTGYQYYEASQSISSTRTIGGGVGTYSEYKAGDFILMHAGFTIDRGSLFYAHIGPCDEGYPSQNSPEHGSTNHLLTMHDDPFSSLAFAKKEGSVLDMIHLNINEPRILDIHVVAGTGVEKVGIVSNCYFPVGKHMIDLDIDLEEGDTIVIKDAHGNILLQE